MIEKHYSLRAAARMVGVERETLKLWLAAEGIVLPAVRRGSKVMLREKDVEIAVRKHRPQMDWSLIRKAS
jgi:predicted site-specific integrase-resolvase